MTMGMTPMGQAVPSNQLSGVSPAIRRRFGRVAARIGTDHIHRCSIEIEVTQKSVMAANDPSETRFDRTIRRPAGLRVQLPIQDITLHPDLARVAKWYCENPSCQLLKRVWSSKEELLADHEDDRILQQKEEVHVYYAAAEVPGRHAKVDKEGNVLEPARAPVVMLLSDER